MKPALIVIDVQKFFLTPQSKRIVLKIRNYLEKNSGKYQQIYFTIFKNTPGSPLWQLADWRGCQNPPETDVCDQIKQFTNKNNLFYKNFLSALKIPAIKRGLKKAKITEVHLCGFDTDCCVLATTYDLFDQKIKPVILENLTWSTSKEKLHRPAMKMIERNVGFTKKV